MFNGRKCLSFKGWRNHGTSRLSVNVTSYKNGYNGFVRIREMSTNLHFKAAVGTPSGSRVTNGFAERTNLNISETSTQIFEKAT